MKTTTKLLSLLLALCMALSLAPMAALAGSDVDDAPITAAAEEAVAASAAAADLEPASEPASGSEQEPEGEPEAESAGDPVEEQLVEEPAEGSAAEPAAEEPEQPDEPEQSDTLGSVVTDGDRDGEAQVSTWAELQDALTNAPDGGTVILSNDLTGSGTMLSFPTGKSVTLDLNGYTLNQNRTTAHANGHVIYVPSGAAATVKNGTLTGGYANNGGGVNNKGALTLEDVTITGNHVGNGNVENSNRGGGIYNSGTLTVTGGTISENSGNNAGGIYNDTSGTATLTNVTITDNQSVNHGGGCMVNCGTATLTNCTVTNNTASGNGGGIWSESALTVTGGEISGNQSQSSGGGVYVEAGTVELTGVTISGNTSAKYGGGIYNDSDSAALTNVSFTENKATGNGGGAIENKGTVTLTDCTINKNTAGTDGGGIDNYGTVTLVDSTISENKANVGTQGDWNGGGIWSNGTLNVQGKVQICYNTTKKNPDNPVANNLYLKSDKVITVTGALSDSSMLWISGESFPRAVTSGWPEGQSLSVVQFDNGMDPGLWDGEVGMSVNYRDRSWDESTQTVVEETRTAPEMPQLITSSSTSLSTGWYVVMQNTTISGRISVPAGQTVNLILMDGVTLTCSQGIYESGILNIYTQFDDTGKLVATGGEYQAGIGGNENTVNGIINIYGGTIQATGGDYGAGIGTGDEPGDIPGTAQVNIYGGTVTAIGGKEAAGIGGGNEGGSGRIHIYGGTVTATGGNYAAAIGGGDEGSCIEVVIDGGTVTAEYVKGNKYSAGIGSGCSNTDAGTIIINNGTVTAKGYNSAGIGSGGDTSLINVSATVSVTINGGTVNAYGYDGGAGIGSGKGIHSNQTIRITGGTVTAIADSETPTSGYNTAAGIGSGGMGDSFGGDFDGTITISGGTVTAIGGNKYNMVSGSTLANYYGGAGLGAGFTGNMSGTITISGGTVTATGRSGGAAIGAGAYEWDGGGGDCDGTVNITGGTVILSIDTDETALIGHGYSCSVDGTLNLGDKMTVLRSNSSDGYPVVAANREKICHSEEPNITLTIAECTYHEDPAALTYTVTADDHTAHCKYCATEFAAEAHSFDETTHACTVCGYEYAGALCTVSFVSGEGSGDMASVQVIPGAACVLPECAFTAPEGTTFKEWSVKIGDNEPEARQPGDTITVTADTTVTAVWENRPVVKAYGCSLSLEGDIAINFMLVIPAEVFADPGAYVTLNDDTTLPIAGAKIVVKDGITMYEFKYRVAAKEMGKDVVLHAFDGEGERLTLQLYFGGKDLTENGYHYSVQRYILLAIRSSTDAELIALMKAMSDYGSKAQMLFGYDTEHAADIYNPEAIDEVTLDDLKPYRRRTEKTGRMGIVYTSANLTLESETTARLFFTVNEGTIGDYSFTVNGKAVEPVERSEGYAIELKNIAAKELDTMYTVEVSDAEGVCLTVRYSALSYAYLVLNTPSAKPALVETVKALYLYNQAAKAYFD